MQATLSFNNAMGSLSDFLYSGVLVRHPRLKLAYSEGQIGWLPYILERADDVWNQFRGWAFPREQVPEPPSTYYYRQVFGCFFRDHHGIRSLEEVGVDNITFETDYPHSDSTWPNTKAVAEKMFAGLERRGHLQDRPGQRHPHAPPRLRLTTDRQVGHDSTDRQVGHDSTDRQVGHDSTARQVTRYLVDPRRSSIVARVRPPMGPPTVPATVTGELDLAAGAAPGPIGSDQLDGHIQVSLDGQPSVPIDLAQAAADTGAELSQGPDGEVVLRGQRSSPAGAFGIVGPPLLNPTILLSWRLVLDPS